MEMNAIAENAMGQTILFWIWLVTVSTGVVAVFKLFRYGASSSLDSGEIGSYGDVYFGGFCLFAVISFLLVFFGKSAGIPVPQLGFGVICVTVALFVPIALVRGAYSRWGMRQYE